MRVVNARLTFISALKYAYPVGTSVMVRWARGRFLANVTGVDNNGLVVVRRPGTGIIHHKHFSDLERLE